jgi:hypothetical protein
MASPFDCRAGGGSCIICPSNQFMKVTPEVSNTVLKSGLDVAARMSNAGKPPGEAIDAAVKHIRSRESLSMLDEARVRDWLVYELPNAVRAASTDSKPEEKTDADESTVLYQKVGAGQFSPVGKPPFIIPPLWLYRLIDGQTARRLSADCIARRKIIVVASAAVFLLVGLFPPWVQTFDLNSTHTRTAAGYAFIMSPPAPAEYSYSIGIQLDTPRLVIELACVLAFGIAAWVLFGGEKSSSRKS